MNIINAMYPKERGKEVALSKLTAEYTQDLDNCQSSFEVGEDLQTLTIETDDAGEGKFFRMKIGSSGWSFDEIDEVVTVLEDFKNRLKC